MSEETKNMILEIKIPEDGFAVGKKNVELGFPQSAIIAMIKRGEKYITPNGSTVLEAGDNLVVLSDNTENIKKVINCIVNRSLDF